MMRIMILLRLLRLLVLAALHGSVQGRGECISVAGVSVNLCFEALSSLE